MSTMTMRVLIAGVIAACLLGVAALEVVSERVRVDLSSTAVQGVLDSTSVPSAELEFREEPDQAPSHMTGALHAGRHTALNVDPDARRVLSLTGTGQVSVSDTDEAQGAGLAPLKSGDIVKAEAPHEQIQKILVLRSGWRELERPEK
jgi:redox-sensitive bicupin YhaK (pirin superfamily)